MLYDRQNRVSFSSNLADFRSFIFESARGDVVNGYVCIVSG